MQPWPLAPGLLLVLAACTLTGESDAVAAARADSSAAGYTVASTDAAPGAPAPVARPTRADSSGPPAGGRRDSTQAGGVPAPSSGTVAASAVPPAPAPKPVVRPRPPRAGTSGRVNEFLSYEPAGRLAELRIIAGYDGSNGSLNFNGASRGRRSVTVPLGWRVRLSTENDDGDLAHSVVVIADASTIPVELPRPAFAGAATADAIAGLATGESETLSFVASRPGRFLIVCGVPGHGQGGQWIGLTVSPTATAPSYTP